MHRFLRLASLWNWLPAFRAVAETEHVRRAADLIFVSPSALSRSIHLLEAEVGAPLFIRAGRNLKLTSLGQELLVAVRTAMRRVDDVLAGGGSLAEGPLVVAAPHAIAHLYVAPALAEIARISPGAQIAPDPGQAVAGLLARGEIDLAFGWMDDRARDLVCTPVGWIRRVLCCALDHPLASYRVVSPDQLLAYPVAVMAGEPIPASVPCGIGLLTQDIVTAHAACASGHLLALVPERLVGDRLRVLDVPVPARQVFASTRKLAQDGATNTGGPLAQSVIDAVRRALARDARDRTAGSEAAPPPPVRDDLLKVA